MLALYTKVELKFLGVYVPSPDETANPQLYADNVRRIYAKEMGVPEIDATIQDKRYYQCKTEEITPMYSAAFGKQYRADQNIEAERN